MKGRVDVVQNPRFSPLDWHTHPTLDHRHDEHPAHGIPDGAHPRARERLHRRRARAPAARHHLARRPRGSHPPDDVSGPRRRPAVPPRSQGSRPSAHRSPATNAPARLARVTTPRAPRVGRSPSRRVVVARGVARRRNDRRRYFPANRCGIRSLFRGRVVSSRATRARGPSAPTTPVAREVPLDSPPHSPSTSPSRAQAVVRSPAGLVVEAFSLTDGMGRSRARRAARSPRGARANVRPKLDLLDGPSRRTGRPSVSASHAASRATRLREAKDPLLGVLDEIGDRAGRAPRAGRRTEFWRSTAARRRGDLSGASATPELAARWFLDDDLLECPGGRVRRSDAHRAVRDAVRGVDPATRGKSPESAREQRRLLGILSGPSDRLGRAERAARGDERAKRGAGRRGKTYDAGKSAESVLGILSGPGRRLGRERRA